jgi:addiction module HigA family antidote
MTNMYNPPHPGETLKEDVLPALGLSVTEAAKQLGVARPTLSNVLNGHAAISVEMALLLEQWLGEERGGRADFWLAQQTAYDLWKGRQSFKTTISRVREGEKRKQTRLETAFN